jgi:hypothetical protein
LAISFPLALPTSIGIANITLSANNAVAISQSPFTFQQQIVQHPGQRWTASVSIPPVRRDLAEPWNAFLLALNGPVGTFLLGDPNAKAPRGSALGFRKNLLVYSEQFNNASWIKTDISVSQNVAVAPDGLSTADALIEVVDPGEKIVESRPNVVGGQTYTLSVYLKSLSGNRRVWMRPAGSTGGASAVVNIEAKTAVVSGSPGSVSISDFGNGWIRCALTYTALSSGVGLIRFQLRTDSSDTGAQDYMGDGTSGVLIWGAQLQEGPLTDYQPIADSYGPFVRGAGQTGSSLIVDAVSPSETGYLLAGDYIQLGSGATATLHKVLQDVDTNESGQATIDIWPNIRTAPADNAIVTLTNTVGRFRLSGNQQSFSINEASIYGISFDCVEAL